MFLSFFDSEDYEMKKSKSSEPRDRLSELPDSLILLILSFLPMRDVVRTALLSKRWKDLWTTVPCLDFTDDTDDLVRFQNFVTRALLLWKGSRIQKLDIVFYHYQSASSDLDLWLRVAMENEVEELNVNLIDDDDLIPDYEDIEYWAPQRLYSCSSIRKLSLVACNLKIHGNVHWNQLKCLTIYVVSLSEHVINQVLSGAPQLEVLILRLMESHENLNIQSSSLKKLTIEMYKYGMDDDEPKDTVLTIWAPNVETLDFSGFLYTEYLLMNVSSLTDATLGFSGPRYRFELHGQKLMQVFQSIHHVEKVTLSDWCIKLYQVLGVMKKKDLLSPLSDAKSLKLYCRKVVKIGDLLELFPKLTMLVLEFPNIWAYKVEYIEPVVLKFDEENPLKSKANFPKSVLLHLRTVEITWLARDASIYPLMEFLLKYASTLEKMVFRPMAMMSVAPDSLFSAAQKLLSMPRSSPTAKVILRKY